MNLALLHILIITSIRLFLTFHQHTLQTDAHTPCLWQAQSYLRIARKQRETTQLHNLFVTGEKNHQYGNCRRAKYCLKTNAGKSYTPRSEKTNEAHLGLSLVLYIVGTC